MAAKKNKIRAAFLTLALAICPALVSVPLILASVGEVHAAVVNRIEVVGNARMDADTVASYLTIEPGKSFNNTDIDESLKQLFATGLFQDVSIYRRGSVLVVEVDENSTVNEVFFEGNKRLKDPALKAEVQTASRSIFNEETVIADLETISNAYARVGRSDADVTYEVVELANNRVNVIFRIDEGEKTKIASIQFIGNHAFSDMRLRDVMRTKETHFFSPLASDDIYDPARIQADEELLRQYYFNHGYADFQIISTVADLDSVKNQYDITITLEEGGRYEFGDISIDSTIPGIDAESLYGELKTRPGDTYSARAIERSIEQVTHAVSATGFAFVEVVPRGDRNFEAGTIDVVYLVDEGPRVYIERIEILGNSRTRDHVIRREFDLSEGDAFNQINVQSTRRRLDALGFFEQVEITTRPGSSPDRVVVIVRVLDKPTGEFSIGGGYSSTEGAIATISFSEKNFLGRGQFFAITGGIGANDQEYRVAFTEPFFLGRRISAGIDLSQSFSEATTSRNYASDATSVSLEFGVPITDNLRTSFYYRYLSSDLTAAASRIEPGSTFDADAIQGNTNGELSAALAPWQGTWVASSVGYTISYSNFDDPRVPREGWRFAMGQNISGVGGDANYVRTDANLTGYLPLSRDVDLVAMGRVRGGHIFSLGGGYRPLDNFFQGGRAIRGFDSYGFGPRDPVTGDALGGMTYFNATGEIQFPMPFFPDSAGIRGAVFADAGSLFGVDTTSRGLIAAANPGVSLAQVNDESLRASAGVSILWDSPFGTLRFDFAEPFSRQPWDRTRRFSFGANTNF